MKKLALILILLQVLTFTSCKNAPATTDIPQPLNIESQTDFAIELFKAADTTDENILISPLSVLCALAMTANGAEGETLSQMETLIGMKREDINEKISDYVNALPSDEKSKLSIANSVWFNDSKDFTVNPDFLQINTDYHNADVYEEPFDNSTLDAVNDWVNKKTDGIIPTVLDRISDNELMYLINALVFDAEWEDIYEDLQISDGNFTAIDGTTRNVKVMYNEENEYIEDDNATGFIKYYKDKKYAFVALLPDTDVTLSDYIKTLDGDKIESMLSSPVSVPVSTAIPKFKTEYSVDMSDVLKKMGLTDAFDAKTADFSSIGTLKDGNIYIDRVVHKTSITVDERGTKAGAVTMVAVAGGGIPKDRKEVYLDRPFLYMLVDCETNTPFFIGKVTDIK